MITFPRCACKTTTKNNRPWINYNQIVNQYLDCQITWQLIQDGDTTGIFQLESFLGQHYAKKIKPSNIRELSDLISLIRPGCLEALLDDGKSVTDHYIMRKHGTESTPVQFPVLEHILQDTYQLLIYQEQAMQIAQTIAGFDLVQADTLRKCVSGQTRFKTLHGEKRIIDMIKDEQYRRMYVFTVEHGEYKLVKIAKIWSTGTHKKTIHIYTENNHIHTTLDHKLAQPLCLSSSPSIWTEAKDFKVGDSINIADWDNLVVTQERIIDIHIDDIPIEMFDFTMVDEQRPWAICNNFLCHNSIGKKLPELMAKSKVMFIEGCKKTNKVTEEDAAQIFSWIEASQRYSFNRSHGVSYAINGYLSAWAKAHFPKQFFTSYLFHSTNSPKPKEEIGPLYNNAIEHGIKIQLPNICKFNTDFKLINDDIYFGLHNIKGLGDAVTDRLITHLKQLEANLSKNVCDFTWLDFLLLVSQHVTSTAVKAIIVSGGLNFINKQRTEMLYEYELYSKLSAREQSWCITQYKLKNPVDLIELLTIMASTSPGKTGGCANKKRQQLVMDIIGQLKNPPYSLIDKPTWLAREEEELLGVAISHNELSDKEGYANTTISTLKQKDAPRKNIFICCKIERVGETVTKRGENPGQKMAFLKLSDDTGILEGAVVFPREYEKFSGLLVQHNTIEVKGYMSKNDSFVVSAVKQI